MPTTAGKASLSNCTINLRSHRTNYGSSHLLALGARESGLRSKLQPRQTSQRFPAATKASTHQAVDWAMHLAASKVRQHLPIFNKGQTFSSRAWSCTTFHPKNGTMFQRRVIVSLESHLMARHNSCLHLAHLACSLFLKELSPTAICLALTPSQCSNRCHSNGQLKPLAGLNLPQLPIRVLSGPQETMILTRRV